MSKNTKPGTKSKGQEKIEQSAYINQIIAPKQAPKEDAHLEAKIEQVKVVTNWPDDDIKRVLEECNYDTQKAISNILDGVAGNPTEDWRVVSKRSATKAETKEHKPPQSSERQDRRGKRSEGRRQDGDRQERSRGPKPPRTENNHQQQKETSNTPSNPITTTPTPPRQTAPPPPSSSSKEHSSASSSTDSSHKPAPDKDQRVVNPSQGTVQPQQPPPQQQQKSQVTPAPQTPTVTPQPTSQKVSQTPPLKPQQPAPNLPAPVASTPPPVQAPGSSSSPSQYRPPAATGGKLWKPKNQEPQSASTAPSTQSQPQQQSTQSPAVTLPTKSTSSTLPQPTERTTQQQVSLPSSTTNPSSGVSSTSGSASSYNTLYSSSPVILPQTLAAKTQLSEPMPEFAFGTLLNSNDFSSPAPSATNEQFVHSNEVTVQSKSAPGMPSQTYIDSERMEQHIRMPVSGQYIAPLDSEHPGLHAFTPYMPPPGPFGLYPHYYDTTADGRTIMMYDQQAFPPYTAPREPSPSESAKYGNVQRAATGNAQNYGRDVKYGSGQDPSGNSSSNNSNNNQQPAQATSPQPNPSQQPTSPATQHYPYGNPMYGYPYLPNQYASYAQTQSQYGYPRYVRPYPNYTPNSTGFPPATSASPMATAYPTDEMQSMTLGQDYKNMSFPPMSGFFPPDMMGTMAKTPQQQQGQQVTPQSSTTKGQYANQSATNAPDLTAASYNKAVQQQQQQQQQPSSDYGNSKSYQPGSSSSFYNVPQQYGQATQAPGGYQYMQMGYSNMSRQTTYLPEGKYQ